MKSLKSNTLTPNCLIPIEWEVATIKDCGHLLSEGINPQQYRDTDFIEYSMPSYDNGRTPNKCKGTDMNSNRTVIKGEVLLFNKLNVRQKRVWYINNAPKNALCSMEFLAYCSNKIDLRLLREILLQDTVTKSFESVSRGTSNSQRRIAPSDFLNFSFALPPMEEQHRIADALSSIDSLTNSLNEAILKKRQIKEGLMQQLLTPGHTNCKWVEKTGRELFSIGNGRDYKGLGKGNIPVYGTGGIIAYVDEFLHEGPTVCIGRKGTIDKPQYHDGKIWTVDTLFYTFNFCGVIPKFLYYIFERVNWHALNEATGVPSLTSKNILNVSFLIPEDEVEQESIVSILDAVESEILNLQNKRDKYASIKQGMMQELLTGKTRLI